MIRIVVADDQALIRSALATTLDLEDDLEVVGQAGTCAEAVEACAASRPDVVLLDVQMPDGGLGVEDGIDAIPALRAGSQPGRRSGGVAAQPQPDRGPRAR